MDRSLYSIEKDTKSMESSSRKNPCVIHVLIKLKTLLLFSVLLSKFGTESFVLNSNRKFPMFLMETRSNIHDRITAVLEPSSSSLPIFDVLEAARDALTLRPNLLLEAPPGAGKTTIVPLSLLKEATRWNLDKDYINIIVVEPRRVATRAAAQRMALLLGETAGETVGYAVRGEARLSKQTQITVVTDGVLLNKLRDDPELSGVDAVVFDEFHERGVGSDTALALCREAQRQLRPDLRLIVMSATLLGDEVEDKGSAGAKLVNSLGGASECQVLRSDGREYPIEMKWAKRGCPPLGALITDRRLLVQTMVDAIEDALISTPNKGDVLAFLPGAREIRDVVRSLRDGNVGSNVEVLPLYGTLPKQEQDYAVFRNNASQCRRVIVSSPIAEASLTIEGVTCVVDSGLRREPRCDVDTGMPRLVTVRCSKASATQRAGRAGRTQSGVCQRLYSKSEYDSKFLEHSPPEIWSTDLTPTALLLSDWGCSRLEEILHEIPFVDAPKDDALRKAFELLEELDAISPTDGNRFLVTENGRSTAKMPTHPRLATAITKSSTNAMLAAAVATAALLDDETGARGGGVSDLAPRIREVLQTGPNSFSGKSLLKFAARISDDAKSAVLRAMGDSSFLSDVTESLGEALLPGFVDLVAQRRGDASYESSTYMLSLGRSARLDGVRDAAEFIVVVDTSTGDDKKARIRSFAGINNDALERVAVERDTVFTVPSRGHEVRARRVRMVGTLELSSTPLPTPSTEEVAAVLLDTIRSLGGVNAALLKPLAKEKFGEIQDLRERVRLATKLSEEPDWPSCFAALDAHDDDCATIDDAEVLEALVEPWLGAAGSLKKIAFLDILLNSMSIEQRTQLDKQFPRRIKAPDGSTIPLSYTDGIPTASAKLQQFFGTTVSPSVGPEINRIPVSISLLSPSNKPLAQTVDLPFFWKEAYPSIRAEMRGRYAKHPWPEDPMTAVPTRRTKKQEAREALPGEKKTKSKKKT